jgi:hypothetical protein
MQAYCSDPLCKRAVALPAGNTWPVRCDACGTMLYPADVLERMLPQDLAPKPGTLMGDRGGRRVALGSADLPAAGDDPSVASVLAMVDTAPPARPAGGQVPDDLRRLARMTIHYRKYLWIMAVPLGAVAACFAPDKPLSGVPMLALAVLMAVVALSKRKPQNQPAIALLMNHPEQIDKIVIADHGVGITAIALTRGSKGYLALLEIEDSKKLEDVIAIIHAYAPRATAEPLDPTKEFVPATARSFFARF